MQRLLIGREGSGSCTRWQKRNDVIKRVQSSLTKEQQTSYLQTGTSEAVHKVFEKVQGVIRESFVAVRIDLTGVRIHDPFGDGNPFGCGAFQECRP